MRDRGWRECIYKMAESKLEEGERYRELLKKINHPLVDVRSRALRSIKFKITNGLLSVSQLANERRFLIHLMEWFNYNTWIHEELALDLLRDATEFDSAVKTLQEVGGVEFFSQLRPHLSSSCQEVVDEILEKLLHLPSSLIEQDKQQTANSPNISSNHSVSSSVPVNTRISHTPSPNRSSNKVESLVATPPSDSLQNVSSVSDKNSDATIRLGSFPWLPLSRVDVKVLGSTLSRLQSLDSGCVSNTWTFIDDVLLNDFPPEVFLQRPDIVECLLCQLKVDTQHTVNLIPPLSTLLSLTHKLTQRVDQQLNPFKQYPMTNNSSLSSQDMESHSQDIILHLVSKQMRLEPFCSGFLSVLVDLLLTSFDRQLPWLDFGCHGNGGLDEGLCLVFGKCLKCIKCISELLLTIVKGCGLVSKEKIIETLDIFAGAVTKCLSKLRRCRESGLTPRPLLRLVCPLLGLLSHWFSLLLLHSSHLFNDKCLLSSQVCVLLKEILTDPFIIIINERILIQLDTLTQTIDNGLYNLLLKERSYSHSFKHLYHFLSLLDEAPPSQTTSEELIEAAEDSLLGLHFCWGPAEKQFVRLAVEKIGTILLATDKGDSGDYKEKSDTSDIMTKGRKILISLFSHNRIDVRKYTYNSLKNFLEGKCSRLSPGLFPCGLIEQICLDLLCSELKGLALSLLTMIILEIKRNNENRDVWKEKVNSILQSLPFIEFSADSCHDNVISLIYTLLDQTSHQIRTCSLLRMMYSTIKSIRERSLNKIMTDYMENEELVVDCSDVLYISPPLNPLIHFYDPSLHITSSSFKSEDICSLLSVVGSLKVETSLRVSALDQLSSILKDISLHEIAVREGLLSLLQRIVMTDQIKKAKQREELLSSSLKCLQLLVLGSETIRNVIISNHHFMINLLKVSFKYKSIRCQVSQVISLLVFSTVLEFGPFPPMNEIKMNNLLLPHIQLPYSVQPSPLPTHTTSSLHTHFISSPPTRRRLWLHYTIAIVGGVDDIPCRTRKEGEEEEAPVLKGEGLIFSDDITRNELSNVLFDLQSLLYTSYPVMVGHYLRCLPQPVKQVFPVFQSLKVSLLLSSLTRDDCSHNSISLTTQYSFQRYFHKAPRTEEDEAVLVSAIDCMRSWLSCDSCNLIGQSQWLMELMTKKESFLLSHLILKEEERKKELVKEILLLISSSLNSMINVPLAHLLVTLLQVLKSDSTDKCVIYLSLQCVLNAVKNISRNNLKARLGCVDAMIDLMDILREIIWSSVTERGTMFGSFMLKGITRSCVQSLSYLLFIMKGISNDKDNVTIDWLNDDKSLLWIHSLLHDRDNEVSCGAYSILSIVSSQLSGVKLLLGSWKELHTNGLLGAMLDTGLCHTECHWIRHQAFTVSVNIILFTAVTNDDQHNITDLINDNGLIKCLISSFDELLLQCHKLLALKESKKVLDCVKSSNHRDKPVKETSLTDWKILVYQCFDNCQLLVVSGMCQFLTVSLFLKETAISTTVLEDIASFIIRLLKCDILQFIFINSSLLWNNVALSWLDLYIRVIALLHTTIISNGYQSHDQSRESHDQSRESHDQSRESRDQSRESRDQAKESHDHMQLKAAVSYSLQLLHYRDILPQGCASKFDVLCLEIVKLLRGLTEGLSEGDGNSSSISEMVWECLIDEWKSFTELLVYSVTFDVQELSLNCLIVFCRLLSSCQTEPSSDSSLPSSSSLGSSPSSLPSCKVSPPVSSTSLLLVINSDAVKELSLTLLEKYETKGGEDWGLVRDLSWSGLCLLLASSKRAKGVMMEAGLLESLTEQLISLHTKLTVDCAARSNRKKQSVCKELVRCFQLLRNTLYGDKAIKSVAVKVGLVNALHVLWPSTVISLTLLKPFLQLLTVLTADCTEAHLALVTDSKGPTGGTGVSLCHQIIKTTSLSLLYNMKSASLEQSSPPPYSIVLYELFSILCNCVSSQECRALMKKTNFFSSFLIINPKVDLSKRSISSPSCLVVTEWLNFLVNLTFTNDGVAVLAKLKGSVDLLCDLWPCLRKRKDRLNCVIVMRNLCFYGPSKAALASNEKVIDIFVQCLKTEEMKFVKAIAAGVQSLLYNCSKTKVLIKNKTLHQELCKTFNSLKTEGNDLSEEVSIALSLIGQ